MLPFGALKPHPGWGTARASRLTRTEEQTEFTLWSVARSPLILGANLTLLDRPTRALMHDKLLIALNQQGDGHPRADLQGGNSTLRVWESTIPSGPFAGRYLAVFNLGDEPAVASLNWKMLQAADGHAATRIHDMTDDMTDALTHDRTDQKTWSAPAAVRVPLAAHGSAVLRVTSGDSSTR